MEPWQVVKLTGNSSNNHPTHDGTGHPALLWATWLVAHPVFCWTSTQWTVRGEASQPLFLLRGSTLSYFLENCEPLYRKIGYCYKRLGERVRNASCPSIAFPYVLLFREEEERELVAAEKKVSRPPTLFLSLCTSLSATCCSWPITN